MCVEGGVGWGEERVAVPAEAATAKVGAAKVGYFIGNFGVSPRSNL